MLKIGEEELVCPPVVREAATRSPGAVLSVLRELGIPINMVEHQLYEALFRHAENGHVKKKNARDVAGGA